jgi:Mg2+ and Co2+ transporter CorA
MREGGILIKPGPAHDSMLEDLIYYYENRSDVLTKEEWGTPKGATIFAKKIVAAHYLQLVDYIKVMLPSLEVAEQEQWKALQTTSRRCGNYRDDIEDTLLSLGYALDTTIAKRGYDWKDCETDYRYIYFRLQILKERTDNLMASMTGLASIAGNQQNLEEAKRLKRLNLLALLFIPLAYTSSLFSMQDEFAPNRSQFWVYWVCAIGVVLFTSIVTWILDSALNDQAEWKVEPRFKAVYDGFKKRVESFATKPSDKPSAVQQGLINPSDAV